jgi:hypothetical protein
MKNKKDDVGCLTVLIFWGAFFAVTGFLTNLPRDVAKRVPTPVPTRQPTPTYSGPSPADCAKETNEEWANLCWEAIEDYHRDRQRVEEHDYGFDEPAYDEPHYYDPFEDGRFVDSP